MSSWFLLEWRDNRSRSQRGAMTVRRQGWRQAPISIQIIPSFRRATIKATGQGVQPLSQPYEAVSELGHQIQSLLAYAKPSSRVFASFRSVVSKPSVNQP